MLIALLAILFCLYRQEIRSLTDQLDFLSQHESNKELSSSLHFKELRRLSEKLNELIRKEKELRELYHCRDLEIQETITHISHDIRTPLTSLSGYFQLLQKTENPVKAALYTEVIKARIEELKTLLEDSFRYVKLADERYELERSEVDLSAELRQSLDSFSELIREKHLCLQVDCPPGLIIWSHQAALQRILNNLLSNALTYAKTRIDLSVSAQEKAVQIQIANDLDPDHRPDIKRIFERYYTDDPSRHRRGSGLGLTIVYRLVTKLAGNVEAELQGQIFQITLEFPRH